VFEKVEEAQMDEGVVKKIINEYINENLLKDIRPSEPSDFPNFLRLDATSSDELLKMITPRIKSKIKNTPMRNAIHTSQLQFFL
jgi:hypothetical protein